MLIFYIATGAFILGGGLMVATNLMSHRGKK